jgi:hypothetical protein
VISHSKARKIACDWYGGKGSALYALCSSGAVNSARPDHDAEAEIADNIWDSTPDQEVNDLILLDAYVKANHGRGAVGGWATLPEEY